MTVLRFLASHLTLCFPNTRVRASVTIINILSASPLAAGNNCWRRWRQRAAHLTGAPLKYLFSSLGQFAEGLCRFPQPGLITIANWDPSGSRGRNELMEVGSPFLPLLALLEDSVQETCGHYFMSASVTPDFHGFMVKKTDWVMLGHRTWNRKRNPDICTHARLIYLCTSGLLETLLVPSWQCHPGNCNWMGLCGRYRGKIIDPFYRWGNEALEQLTALSNIIWLEFASRVNWSLNPGSFHFIIDSWSGSPGFSSPFIISFLFPFFTQYIPCLENQLYCKCVCMKGDFIF